MVVRGFSKAITMSVGIALATLPVAACNVLYPRGVVGQVLTSDKRADVLCTLSLYEALDTENPLCLASSKPAASSVTPIRLLPAERPPHESVKIPAMRY